MRISTITTTRSWGTGASRVVIACSPLLGSRTIQLCRQPISNPPSIWPFLRWPRTFLHLALPSSPPMTAIYVRRLTSQRTYRPHKFTETCIPFAQLKIRKWWGKALIIKHNKLIYMNNKVACNSGFTHFTDHPALRSGSHSGLKRTNIQYFAVLSDRAMTMLPP